jgi:hypothetical protein
MKLTFFYSKEALLFVLMIMLSLAFQELRWEPSSTWASDDCLLTLSFFIDGLVT